MLPQHEQFNQLFKEHFIFYKPKDIVSGDFYWLNHIQNETEDKIILAAGDCTGHGVPGAFMSILGMNSLHVLVNEYKIYDPKQILSRMRTQILDALIHQEGTNENKDGMDIAVCVIDKKNQKLLFSGANASLIVYHKALEGQQPIFETIAGNKMPVGYHYRMGEYDLHTFELSGIQSLYFSSDGFKDQFGGPKSRKLGTRAFRELIQQYAHLPMKEQNMKLETFFSGWIQRLSENTNTIEQYDDVMVIGVQLI